MPKAWALIALMRLDFLSAATFARYGHFFFVHVFLLLFLRHHVQ
jgi:hypothetical protein